jgi:outer membrane biosynthesis protein TonB
MSASIESTIEQESLSQEELRLRAELEEAERELAPCKAELEAAEADLQALEDKRVQFEPLEEACQVIEKLEASGLSRTFWGDRATDADVVEHMVEVRGRIESIAGKQIEAEARREAARKRLRQQLDQIALIEGDLLQAIETEERRRQEWLVEREATELQPRLQILPWTRDREEDSLYRRSMLGAAAAALLLGLMIPLIDIPIPEKEEITEVPERFARLIRKEPLRAMPEPTPMQKRVVEEKPPEEKPEVKPEPEAKPEVQVAETQQVEVAPEAPRDKVASTGLLAFRESFSNLASGRPNARLGSEARVSDAGQEAIGAPQRSMVSVDGPGSSGGINVASLSRDVGGAGTGEQMEGVALSRVASSIGATGGDRPLSSGAIAGRTDEEIQIVFDRYKAALYRLYNRELRSDPSLKGQMVLKLTIEPDGSVSICSLQSSDMNAPTLAEQVVARVLGFDFGAKEVPAVTILYPIDFLPTA